MKLALMNIIMLFLVLVPILRGAVNSELESHLLRREFSNPPKAFRPMIRWWWPGGDVSDAELTRELRLMDEAGFGGAEIQPFRTGLRPELPASKVKRVNDYMTPTFYAHVRAALDEANRRGMWLDYTLGSGWPFGGGKHITPELAAVELRVAHKSVKGPLKYRDKIPLPRGPSGEIAEWIAQYTGIDHQEPPQWKNRMRDRQKLVAVVAVRGEEAIVDSNSRRDPLGRPQIIVTKTGSLEPGTEVLLTDRVLADGTLEWEIPDGTWQLFTFMQFPADLRVLGGVGNAPQPQRPPERCGWRKSGG